MSFRLHQLKKRILAATSSIVRVAAFTASIIAAGTVSSCYMVDAGTRLTTESTGPWVTWTAASRTDADPYTRTHFARLGALPLSTEVARLYIATEDSDGSRLHSSCEYLLEGRDIASHWWSLTVYDSEGRLIPNPAERYGFTSDTIALHPDATFTVALARDARPENWLPVGGAGQLAVAFNAIDLGTLAVARDGDPIAPLLPIIKRTTCR